MNGIHISKREDLPKKRETVIRILAVILSIVCAGLVIWILGYNPIRVFPSMISGALGTEIRLQQTILKAIPLIVTSLGILVAFKMKFWNIGGEGQIIMGALAASYVALNMDGLPKGILLSLMALAAMIAGGLWAFIPAFFKAKMGVNETIFTLMLNYIAIKYVTYLQYGPWKSPESQGFPKVATFSDNAVLPKLFGIHIGWLIALLLVVIVYIFINHTKKGFEISVVGESRETARYAGMNIATIILIAMFISGGLCGLTGMIQASAVEKTLSANLSGGYGFTAIITAWLARLNAIAVLFVCIAFAILLQGGAYIQISMQIPAAVADMMQGIILFFVLGSEFFLQYKVNLAGSFRKAKEVA
ncbi:MAG: ABC transporter permease [Eubacteriales bacterium]|nr:ABC transporter permease [Eubacteriales bacterium]MDD4583238.1 ABC transporter permease [Eubacteriales bacterium]